MRLLLPFLLTALLSGAAHADTGTDLAAAARAQIGVTLKYDTRYQRMAYPNGDVPVIGGMSGDVVIRAYRTLGIDLQKLVIEDMAQGGSGYARGRKGVDRSMDHRRVQNLATFFKRQGATLPMTKDKTDYLPGDIVTYSLPGGAPHIAIISEQKSQTSVPLLIHNLRAGVKEDNALFTFRMTGHYRWRPAAR